VALESTATLLRDGGHPFLAIVVQAGNGAFAKALSTEVERTIGVQQSSLCTSVLLDTRYFRRNAGEDLLKEMAAFEKERDGRGPKLVAKRFPGSQKERKALLCSLMGGSSYKSIAVFSPHATESGLALELVRFFIDDIANSAMERSLISLATCDLPSPQKMQAHAEGPHPYPLPPSHTHSHQHSRHQAISAIICTIASPSRSPSPPPSPLCSKLRVSSWH
jgi:hypothetical protein